MRFIDTNIFAYAFYDNEHTLVCQDAIRDGGVTDTFALIEAFLVIEEETGNREVAVKALKGILKSDITVIDVDLNLFFETLKKIVQSKLSIFDCIHLTCALFNNCTEILSYDKDFDHAGLPRIEPT